jgi:hypothetical protein
LGNQWSDHPVTPQVVRVKVSVVGPLAFCRDHEDTNFSTARDKKEQRSKLKEQVSINTGESRPRKDKAEQYSAKGMKRNRGPGDFIAMPRLAWKNVRQTPRPKRNKLPGAGDS